MLSPGKVVPSGEIWAGNPARFLRNLEEGEADFVIQSANNYSALAVVHAAENGKTFEEIEVGAQLVLGRLMPKKPSQTGYVTYIPGFESTESHGKFLHVLTVFERMG